ncbi:hypothetical protein [Plantactinospora sp. CA-290183]|uniref:hypothetical protein n=1 Tax=Plantactinospora sp. CA-290183 TaxID=3240006 RepID=UPI003D93FCD8
MPEGPPGLAIDWAWASLRTHADGHACIGCRGYWCPTAEWALWVAVSDQLVDGDDRRQAVTVVARQVLRAHWPRTVDGCRPCGLPNCERARLAGGWLDAIGDPYVPPTTTILRPTTTPTDDDLRRITEMD